MVIILWHWFLMTNAFASALGLLLKAGAVILALNEIRGLILAGPVLYSIYASGGTFAAIWISVCSLGGIALSVLVPLFAAKKLQAIVALRSTA
jgi:hypothetical protein